MPLPPKSAAVWLPPPHSGAGGAVAYERSGKDGRRRRRLWLWLWRGARRDPWGARRAPAGSCRARPRRSQATRSIPPPVGSGSGASVQGSGPGPSRTSCGGEHRGCMRLARARAKGEGSAEPPQPQPSVCTAPRTFSRGSPGAWSSPQVCKAALRRRRAGRLCGAASRANRNTAPGPPAQAQAARTHSLTRAGTATTRQPV